MFQPELGSIRCFVNDDEEACIRTCTSFHPGFPFPQTYAPAPALVLEARTGQGSTCTVRAGVSHRRRRARQTQQQPAKATMTTKTREIPRLPVRLVQAWAEAGREAYVFAVIRSWHANWSVLGTTVDHGVECGEQPFVLFKWTTLYSIVL